MAVNKDVSEGRLEGLRLGLAVKFLAAIIAANSPDKELQTAFKMKPAAARQQQAADAVEYADALLLEIFGTHSERFNEVVKAAREKALTEVERNRPKIY